MQRNVYLNLMSLPDAKKLWLAAFEGSVLTKIAVPIAEARGRTLAEPAVAVLSSPAFHGAAMDGIAVLAENTFGASESRPKKLCIGREAFWINTGHPLPKGTNAVIMVENVIMEYGQVAGGSGKDLQAKQEQAGKAEEFISIEKAAFPWQHVRKLGEDMVATEILLPAGTVVGAYELGALAASGVLNPVVFARPKVAIIPSGSELVPLTEASHELLASGKKLPEFNSVVLDALVQDAGGVAEIYPIVPDEPEEIKQAILRAAKSDADLIVINAGSSAGSHDYTSGIIKELGELWVHGVKIMPGKPTALGKVMGKPIIGIPGYPISAIISFEEFAQPLLAKWQGRQMSKKPKAMAQPFQALPSRAGMEECIRVKLGLVDDNFVAVPMPRGAGTVSSLSRADGIIRIAEDVEGLPANQPTEVNLLHSEESIKGALLAIGSHDNTLDLLDSMLRKFDARFSLTSAHVGSLGGLMALKAGRCHLAGSHLLDSATGVYNLQSIADHLQGVPLEIVRLVDREQGLLVPKGNPDKIEGVADLVRPEISFINRQKGSGTRVLLDWKLQELGISSSSIAGYEDEEYTHMNVAAAVLSGRASTGLGVRSAANALGLDFIPVGVEQYDLIIAARFWNDPRMKALLEVIRSAEFKETVHTMGGYGVEQTGEHLWTFEG